MTVWSRGSRDGDEIARLYFQRLTSASRASRPNMMLLLRPSSTSSALLPPFFHPTSHGTSIGVLKKARKIPSSSPPPESSRIPENQDCVGIHQEWPRILQETLKNPPESLQNLKEWLNIRLRPQGSLRIHQESPRISQNAPESIKNGQESSKKPPRIPQNLKESLKIPLHPQGSLRMHQESPRISQNLPESIKNLQEEGRKGSKNLGSVKNL